MTQKKIQITKTEQMIKLMEKIIKLYIKGTITKEQMTRYLINIANKTK